MMRWTACAGKRGDRGASAVEYAILVVTVAVFVFGVAGVLGDALAGTIAVVVAVAGDVG